MGRFTGNRLGAVFHLAGTGKGLVQNVRHTFQGCRSSDHLENRAGNIDRLHKPVQVHTVPASGGIGCDIRYVIRVVGRCGDGAEDLTGFVIVHRHGALAACHGLQGGVLHLSGKGQLCLSSGAGSAVDTVYNIKTRHLGCIGGNGICLDIALPVTQPMEGGFPGGSIFRIGAVFCDIQQSGAAAVHDGAAADVGAVVHMGRAGEDHPFSGLCCIFPQEEHHASQQRKNEDGHQPGSLGYAVHGSAPFLVQPNGKAGILPGIRRLDKGQQPPGTDHTGAAVT